MQPEGYFGIDGAWVLLNDKVYKSMSKDDAEIPEGTDNHPG